MKKIYQLALIAVAALLILSGCEEESDMAFDRVASPVLLVTDPVGTDEIQATFYELDKTGILDQDIGIDSIPIPNLSIEVFSSNTSIGTFTTNTNGSIIVQDAGSLAWSGEYNGVRFRFQ
ncbi:hypothetical protein [Tunicatimonas pelagia]|uniref:hypothetical protein n=1 Tax=Tunicatimonas pelagia TaxID=931531 RepID=UPI00266700B8|nr:hypothetical protein [Tunicatimonas pelagia]WKN42900.1 hypothetical protein P0M28_28075 [Tunicatimonas pelagia]